MKTLKTQSIWKSFIFILSFASVIAEAVLGIMLSIDAIDPQLAGSIMTGLSGIVGWGCANNPSSADDFLLRPTETKPSHVTMNSPTSQYQECIEQTVVQPMHADEYDANRIWFDVEEEDR